MPVEPSDGASRKDESSSSSTAKHRALLRSIRRTTNPDLKTTKTGKIQHKSRKAGVNRRSTAYNRFLQQQSKYLAKEYPHLTPQQACIEAKNVQA
ncbi:hypothetical protein BGZ82_011284 [Podila clonocystis]|nr:hypothetical protein BGZ82_011284 [Podila clonocystis]